jgi:hypothetical protein
MKRRIAGIIVSQTRGLSIAPFVASAQRSWKVSSLGVLVPAEAPSPEEPSLADC